MNCSDKKYSNHRINHWLRRLKNEWKETILIASHFFWKSFEKFPKKLLFITQYTAILAQLEWDDTFHANTWLLYQLHIHTTKFEVVSLPLLIFTINNERIFEETGEKKKHFYSLDRISDDLMVVRALKRFCYAKLFSHSSKYIKYSNNVPFEKRNCFMSSFGCFK